MTAAFGLVPLEEVISTAPLTIRREVRWSDCDPAGVVHTGRFPDYALSAVNHLRGLLIGTNWYEIMREAGCITPAKAMSLVFHAALWPHDRIDIRVFISEVRARSLDILLDAVRADDGSAVFSGRISPVCIGATGPRAAMAWPAPFRDAFNAYRDAHAVPDALKKLDV